MHVASPDHERAVADAETREQAPRTLIVGKRTSAGQAMLTLHRRGHRLSLSVRAPIVYRRHGWYGTLRETLYFVHEGVRVRLGRAGRGDSFPPMDGGASSAVR